MKLFQKYQFYKKDVMFGWDECVAVSFPNELAVDMLGALKRIKDKNVISNSSFFVLHDVCLDVLHNHKEGNETYIIAPMWGFLVDLAERVSKLAEMVTKRDHFIISDVD